MARLHQPRHLDLPTTDYTMRHLNKVSQDCTLVTPTTIKHLLDYFTSDASENLDIGRYIPWMGARMIPTPVLPISGCLIVLQANRNCLFDPDEVPHYSCFSFPTRGRSHIAIQSHKLDTSYNNSSSHSTLQHGSGTWSNARTRIPKFQAQALAVQRSMGFQPNSGVGSTTLINSVPSGRYSNNLMPLESIQEMLQDRWHEYEFRLNRYPAVRRKACKSQVLLFTTGTFTLPGVCNVLDLASRLYNVVVPYATWRNGLSDKRSADLEDRPAVSNYKRSDSRPRVRALSREQIIEGKKRRELKKTHKRLAKALVRHFKAGLIEYGSALNADKRTGQ